MNLNTPAINAGPLTAADLDRRTNNGRIYHLHRITVAGRDTCNGSCQSASGCDCCWPDSCAIEGGEHREPSRTVRDNPGIGLALVLLGWPAVAAVVGAVLVIVHNLPSIG